jgi:hypothetical protein
MDLALAAYVRWWLEQSGYALVRDADTQHALDGARLDRALRDLAESVADFPDRSKETK